MGYKVGLIRGDGIGPEVIGEAEKLIRALPLNIDLIEIQAGYNYYKKTGKIIEDGGLELIRSLDATLKGPLMTPPGPGSIRSINVYLRQRLQLYANIRPFTGFKGVSLHEDFDLVIVRENTEGLYSGFEGRINNVAFSMKIATYEGSLRIIKKAVEYAESRDYRKLTLVHKANILKESDGLFREVFWEVVKNHAIAVDELFVDAAAYWIAKDPKKFGAIVTPNLYGDILSDLAAGITGSLGLCGSAQVGSDTAVFEPVHGTAPDIAGKGIANPISAVIATALLIEHVGIRHDDDKALNTSRRIKDAVKKVVEDGKVRTPDLGGTSSTQEMGEAILNELEKGLL